MLSSAHLFSASSTSKGSRSSVAPARKRNKYLNDNDNNNCGKGAEIWVYTKSLEMFNEAKSNFESSSSSSNANAGADIVVNAFIPIFKHWILVAKFKNLTLWMEAFENEGVLQADILDDEPKGVEERSFIGEVPLTVNQIIKLFNSINLLGQKYSLTGANCQSFIKAMLKELGLGKNLKIVNDVIILLGAAGVGFGIGLGGATAAGFPLAAAGLFASVCSSGSESSLSSKKLCCSGSSKS